MGRGAGECPVLILDGGEREGRGEGGVPCPGLDWGRGCPALVQGGWRGEGYLAMVLARGSEGVPMCWS